MQPSPASQSLYSTIDWTTVLSIQHSSITITAIRYDSNTDRVTIDFNYLASLNSDSL